MKLLVSYNKQVGVLVLTNTPQDPKYTSHWIQKEILNVFLRNAQSSICCEIGDTTLYLKLLMKLEMNPKDNKWPLLLHLLIEMDLYENIFF
jgi:hypothetical protein